MTQKKKKSKKRASAAKIKRNKTIDDLFEEAGPNYGDTINDLLDERSKKSHVVVKKKRKR
jgi:hypothetical protein